MNKIKLMANKTNIEIPRQNDLEQNTPAELSIRTSMIMVEGLGADPKLTEVTMLLDKAKRILGDYIDAEIEKEKV